MPDDGSKADVYSPLKTALQKYFKSSVNVTPSVSYLAEDIAVALSKVCSLRQIVNSSIWGSSESHNLWLDIHDCYCTRVGDIPIHHAGTFNSYL